MDKDTTLAVRASQWVSDSVGSGKTLAFLEKPRHSLLWELDELQQLVNLD